MNDSMTFNTANGTINAYILTEMNLTNDYEYDCDVLGIDGYNYSLYVDTELSDLNIVWACVKE